MKLRALTNKILCKEMEKGELLSTGGIILIDDDISESGIRPRWMQVFSVGPDVTDVKEGNWIMVKHGRWTHGMILRHADNKEFTIWAAEEESVLLVTDEKPAIERSASTAN